MKVAVYKSGSETHDQFLAAMLKGCPWQATWVMDKKPVEADIGVVWGLPKKAVPISWWREDVLNAHKCIVNMDSGYMKRGSAPENYQMVGVGGLNGRAEFRFDKAKPDRWERLHLEMKPWREEGRHILLVGQVPWDASVQHVDHHKWLRDVVFEIVRHTDRPIRFRPHPLAWQAMPPISGTTYSRDPLEDDLHNCHCVVTFNSNTGVDAILAGVPVYYHDKGSMTKGVGFDDLGKIADPPMPERAEWAHQVAYAQWNMYEMSRGLPWHHLFEGNDE